MFDIFNNKKMSWILLRLISFLRNIFLLLTDLLLALRYVYRLIKSIDMNQSVFNVFAKHRLLCIEILRYFSQGRRIATTGT